MFDTEQENFWAGRFGDEYITRNLDKNELAARLYMFANILNSRGQINGILEFGPNIGLNLKALRLLLPKAELCAVEINEKAARACAAIEGVKVFNESLLDFRTEERYDLTFTSGVLIHINPGKLSMAYETLYRHSRRYILMMEYYNPTPVEVIYRGHEGKLFKRDFPGEFMKKYPDVHLVDYGCTYHGDNNFYLDDFNWFLMEKSNN